MGLLRESLSQSLGRGLVGQSCTWEGIWKISGTWMALYQQGERVHGHLPGKGAHLIGRATKSGLLRAKIGQDGTCLTLTMGESCLKAEGWVRPCARAVQQAAVRIAMDSGAAVQKLVSQRMLGEQCWARTAKVCSPTNEDEDEQPYMHTGIQPCSFGFWSTNCLASRCASGSCLVFSPLLGAYTCEPCGMKVS